MTCWQNLQVRVQVQVHSFQVQVQVRVLRAKVQVQVQVQQKGLKSGLESKSGLEYYKSVLYTIKPESVASKFYSFCVAYA